MKKQILWIMSGAVLMFGSACEDHTKAIAEDAAKVEKAVTAKIEKRTAEIDEACKLMIQARIAAAANSAKKSVKASTEKPADKPKITLEDLKKGSVKKTIDADKLKEVTAKDEVKKVDPTKVKKPTNKELGTIDKDGLLKKGEKPKIIIKE